MSSKAKLWVAAALTGLAGVAVAAWIAFVGAAGGPSLLDDLDATHTVLAAEARQLDDLARHALAVAEQVPHGPDLPLPPRAEVVKRLGADPADPAAWRGWGVDPSYGVAFAIDDRVVRTSGPRAEPLPIALLRVTDRALLIAAFAKAGVPVTLGRQVGAVQEATIAGEDLLIAPRGADLAILPGFDPRRPDAAAVRDAFERFVAPASERLAAIPSFRSARRDSGRAPIFAWTRSSPWAAWLDRDSEQRDFTFFAALFPSAAAWIGDRSGVRVEATPPARAALAEIGRPKRNPPRCARLFPRSGWAAARTSVNLEEAVTGLGKLLPPSVPANTRTGLAMSTGMLALVGVGWGDVTAAFSGHACGGVEIAALPGLKAGAAPKWLAAVGIVDVPKVDALLSKLVALADDKGKGAIAAVEVGGYKGWQLRAGALGAVVVRGDDILLAGPDAATVEAALRRDRGESLAATVLADVVDGPVIAGAGGDLQAAVDAALALPGGEARLREAWAALAKGERYAGAALALDDRGLLLSGRGDPRLQAVFGVAAPAAAVFGWRAFSVAKARTQAVAGRHELDRVARAAVRYYGEIHADGAPACQFPPPAPLNPPSPCCRADVDKDGDGRCDADAFAAHPTWRALGFSPSPSPFQYVFESSGSLALARFTARAVRSDECGDAEVFAVHGHGKVDADGRCVAELDGPVEREDRP